MRANISKIKNVWFFLSLFALFALAAYGIWRDRGTWGDGNTFFLRYRQDGAVQQVKGFSSDGILYFCLPSYMELEDVTVELPRAGKLETDGEDLTFGDGDGLKGIALNTEYRMCVENRDGKGEPFSVVFMQGSGIPAVWLDTASGGMEYILAKKGNSEGGYMQVVDAEGRTDCMVKVDGVFGRGNTAWDAVKKSFTVKLDDAEDVLGMGAEKTWVLNANYYDGAYVRNQIGFEMAAAGGIAFVPEARFVDLYINGEYMGLYQLMEKLKVGKNRVDIGDNYFLEVDYRERAAAEEDYIMLSNEQPIVIHAPAKDRDVDGVRRFFDAFSRKMEEGEIPAANMDMESFARMFVMEDILQDMDFGYTSHYMYLDLEKEILYDGPVWDLDNTMGRGNKKEAEPLFVTDYDLVYNNMSRWYRRLCGQEDFCRLAAGEYREKFRPALKRLAEGGVRERVREIKASIAMDARRFTGSRSLFMGDASLEEHVAYLENYLKDKLAVMDAGYGEDMWKNVQGTALPALERQESAFEEEEGTGNSGMESGGAETGWLAVLVKYRFPVILLVMGIGGVILWYQCRDGYQRNGF